MSPGGLEQEAGAFGRQLAAPGVRRLVERCGFEILGMDSNQGSGAMSIPAGKVDERVFLLLRSRVYNANFDEVKLLKGWHKTDNGGWRWTGKAFGVAAGSAQIRCLADRVDLGSEYYEEAGEHCWQGTLSGRGAVELRFTVSHAFVDLADGRDLGLFVRSVRFG